MSGVHWSRANEDIAHLICLVNSQDHVIEGSCDIITILPSLVAIAIAVVEMFFDLLRELTRPGDSRAM